MYKWWEWLCCFIWLRVIILIFEVIGFNLNDDVGILGRSVLIGVVVGFMIVVFIFFGVVVYLIWRRLRKWRVDNGIWDKV